MIKNHRYDTPRKSIKQFTSDTRQEFLKYKENAEVLKIKEIIKKHCRLKRLDPYDPFSKVDSFYSNSKTNEDYKIETPFP